MKPVKPSKEAVERAAKGIQKALRDNGDYVGCIEFAQMLAEAALAAAMEPADIVVDAKFGAQRVVLHGLPRAGEEYGLVSLERP